MPQNDQDEQQSKVDRRNHKEVHCADTGHMIAQERLPRLARPGPMLGHVLGDGRLCDLDPKLQQLAMKARRTPEWVLHAHPPDQTANLNWNLGPTATPA